jgi:hypothetical protein
MVLTNGLQRLRRAATDVLRAGRVSIIRDAGAARVQGINTPVQVPKRSPHHIPRKRAPSPAMSSVEMVTTPSTYPLWKTRRPVIV